MKFLFVIEFYRRALDTIELLENLDNKYRMDEKSNFDACYTIFNSP